MSQRVEAHSQWSNGDFCRDTLIFCVGSLAESVLVSAFHEKAVTEQYKSWLDDLEYDQPTGTTQPLLETGFDDVKLTLLARDRSDEFCIVIDSGSFNLTVPVGFDPNCGLLKALWIARFDGCLKSALQATSSLRYCVRQRRSLMAAPVKQCH